MNIYSSREEAFLKINFNAHLPLFFIKTTILEIITLKVTDIVQELAQFTWLAPGAISPIVENCVAQAGFILVKQVGIRSQHTIHKSVYLGLRVKCRRIASSRIDRLCCCDWESAKERGISLGQYKQ
jgi:hypothetical protein